MTHSISPEQRQRIRDQFPALAGETIYLENAGGSQVPGLVADRIHRYMLESYVQLGAGYGLSEQCTRLVDEAHDFVKLFMNGAEGQVILGSSTTALLHMLAACYRDILEPGREIIVAENGHEANVGPWKNLERRGMKLVWWRVDSDSSSCSIEQLSRLLNSTTAIVALPHVSNLLGEIYDLKRITSMVHDAGARVVADGVAFAPHRAIDVNDWGVDWYAYSAYKVYGPHMAALWGTANALSELTGPNHFFIADDEIPYKFELGGPSHEACAGILALGEYLRLVTAAPDNAPIDRGVVEHAFAIMEACELPLQHRLIDYLESRSDIRIIGPTQVDSSRVGTISFVHSTKSSREITEVVDRSAVAIRNGHMYAYHLCETLGLDPEDGVVRISFVHYNTLEEIEKLIEVLDVAMGPRP